MRGRPGLEDDLHPLGVWRPVADGRSAVVPADAADVVPADAADADRVAEVGLKSALGRLAPNPRHQPPRHQRMPAPPFGTLRPPACPGRLRLPSRRTPLGIGQHLLLPQSPVGAKKRRIVQSPGLTLVQEPSRLPPLAARLPRLSGSGHRTFCR